MIEISIDKTNATPEEIAALDAMPGYEQLVSSAVNGGRKEGVLLTIKEPMAGGSLWLQNNLSGAMQMIAGPSSSQPSVLNIEETKYELAEGNWVADFTDAERPRIARVKDIYSVAGDVVLDLVLYSRDGTKIGRESPACGGPRGFEPACPIENWAQIEEPDFDYLARSSKYNWGDRVQRIAASQN